MAENYFKIACPKIMETSPSHFWELRKVFEDRLEFQVAVERWFDDNINKV